MNCSPDLRNLIQSMLEVDPRKRPSIEEILMRPCCLTRLHALYPQYIPTLFPYTTPSFHLPSSPSVSSPYSKQHINSISPPGHTPIPSVQSSSNRDSSSQEARLASQDSSRASNDTLHSPPNPSPQGIVRSSPSIVLQRVKDDDGLSTEESSVSNPRRISLPSRLEVRPIVRRVSVGEPISIHRVNSKSVTNDHSSRQHEVIVKPHKVHVAAIHDSPPETDSIPVIRPLKLSPVSGSRLSQATPVKDGQSVQSNSIKESRPVRVTPVKEDRPLIDRPLIDRPLIDQVELDNPRMITVTPMKHGKKNELGWRIPSEEEERRHKEGLQELRDRYLAIRKKQ